MVRKLDDSVSEPQIMSEPELHPTFRHKFLAAVCLLVPAGIVGIWVICSRSPSLDLADPVNLTILIVLGIGLFATILSPHFVKCPKCGGRCRKLKSKDGWQVECRECGARFSLGVLVE
jgi:hypothetical protein